MKWGYHLLEVCLPSVSTCVRSSPRLLPCLPAGCGHPYPPSRSGVSNPWYTCSQRGEGGGGGGRRGKKEGGREGRRAEKTKTGCHVYVRDSALQRGDGQAKLYLLWATVSPQVPFEAVVDDAPLTTVPGHKRPRK